MNLFISIFSAQVVNNTREPNASISKSTTPAFSESSFHRSASFLSSLNQSEYTISTQFLPTQHIPSRSPTSSFILSKSFPHSTKNPTNNWSSFKNTTISSSSPIPDIKINNNLCFTASTCSSTVSSSTVSDSYSRQNASIPSYNHLRPFAWNTNLFYPQQRSLGEGLLSYPTTFGNLLDNKIHSETSRNSTKISTNEVSSSSNCSELNSDSESIDVSDQDKDLSSIDSISTSKKRNPYSIEELLKKPDKIKRHTGASGATFKHSIILKKDKLSITTIPDGNRDTFICSRDSKNNQFTIEVYD